MPFLKKLDVRMDGAGLKGEYFYPTAAVDLSEIAMVADNSGGAEQRWLLILKSGKEITVRPHAKDFGFTFGTLMDSIERAKTGGA